MADKSGFSRPLPEACELPTNGVTDLVGGRRFAFLEFQIRRDLVEAITPIAGEVPVLRMMILIFIGRLRLAVAWAWTSAVSDAAVAAMAIARPGGSTDPAACPTRVQAPQLRDAPSRAEGCCRLRRLQTARARRRRRAEPRFQTASTGSCDRRFGRARNREDPALRQAETRFPTAGRGCPAAAIHSNSDFQRMEIGRAMSGVAATKRHTPSVILNRRFMEALPSLGTVPRASGVSRGWTRSTSERNARTGAPRMPI